ncbi:Gfo/Idh/MocA family protein [Aquabacterium sp. J223]|uniref:Gfo/Idh/MocA family protein n=1 Tax=Aquabacterium sp. J223 TaxID=2898431 RepID=UPI0021ADD611|nr:Gfo/Idh/MocA family oxidoreductase [Aquabacterium sp. J223]UUX94584.1 Gfo/Idh/MocA family oxidoreductase [Aquabacterium sp. J223]
MLNVAIEGLGRWGTRLVESVQGSPALRFVAGITGRPEAHADFARRFGLRLLPALQDALTDPGIDALVLATPHSQHADQIARAAAAGKHVFVEKPLALRHEDAERATDACERAGVTLGVGFNRRWSPAWQEMARRIAAGEIGRLLHLEAAHSGPSGLQLKPGAWRSDRAECPLGAMTPRGVHALDAVIGLAGCATSVFAFSDRRVLTVDLDDTTSLLLRFEGGVTASLSTLHATAEWMRVHAFGSAGWLEMRGDTELTACALQGPPRRLELAPVDKERAELEAFAQAVATGRRFVLPREELLNGVAVVDAALASVTSGRAEAVAARAGR